jgi:urea transport system permease protein
MACAMQRAARASSATGSSTTSWFVWVVSAMLAGIAGALYVPQVGIINPGEFSPANSIEIIVWVAVGGRGTLYGAALGGVVVNYAKTYFTGAAPEIWLYLLGGLFIAVTLLLPKGIVGTASDLWQRRRELLGRRRAPPIAATAEQREAAE